MMRLLCRMLALGPVPALVPLRAPAQEAIPRIHISSIEIRVTCPTLTHQGCDGRLAPWRPEQRKSDSGADPYLAAVLLGAVGAAVGVALYSLTSDGECTGDYGCFFEQATAGLLGESIGIGLGAYIGNGSRGSLAGAIAGSVLTGFAGVAVAGRSGPVLLLAVPIVQIIAAVETVERTM